MPDRAGQQRLGSGHRLDPAFQLSADLAGRFIALHGAPYERDHHGKDVAHAVLQLRGQDGLPLLASPAIRDVLGDLQIASKAAVDIGERDRLAVEEDPASILAQVPSDIGRGAGFEGGAQLPPRDAGLTVLWGEDQVGGLAEHFGLRPAQDLLRSCEPVGDPVFGVAEHHDVVARALDHQAKPLVGPPQLDHGFQPVHDGAQHHGVGLEERDVVLIELAPLLRVNLQDTVGLAARQQDRDVYQRDHAMVVKELREVEPLLLGDVVGDHRLGRLDGVGFRGSFAQIDPFAAHDTRAPPHAGAHQGGVRGAVDLENLGEVGAERLRDDAASLLEHRLEVVVVQHEVAELGEGVLAPQQLLLVGHFEFLNAPALSLAAPSCVMCSQNTRGGAVEL